MATMAQAIRSYAESVGGPFTSDQLKRHIEATYPGQWKASTLQAHMYACVANNPKAYVHHPSVEKFLYRHADGRLELYSEALHGPNEWAPTPSEDEEATVGELAETSISLERDIEDHLVHHLDAIEKGMKFVGRQVSTDVGRIDVIAEDAKGARVIIEIKVGEAKDSAVGQIARYLGWYARSDGRAPRGILIAGTFPEGVRYAAEAIANLSLIAYRVNFAFEQVKV